MRLTILLLFISIASLAQVPAGFKNVYDSITFVADPAMGNSAKQVIAMATVPTITIPVPSGFFKPGAYTTTSNTPFSKFVRFSAFMSDSIDSSKNPVVNITMVPYDYLVVVEKSAMTGELSQKIPVFRLYEAGKHVFNSWFFAQGNYYYCYLKRTKVNQEFMIDWSGGGDVNKMTKLNPVPGSSGTFAPVLNTITINLSDPYR